MGTPGPGWNISGDDSKLAVGFGSFRGGKKKPTFSFWLAAGFGSCGAGKTNPTCAFSLAVGFRSFGKGKTNPTFSFSTAVSSSMTISLTVLLPLLLLLVSTISILVVALDSVASIVRVFGANLVL